MHELYLAKGALGTTAIEGNTLSEQQVRDLIEGTLKLPPSQDYLAQEIRNIIRACNAMQEQIRDGEIPPLSTARICDLNREVLAGLETEKDIRPGEIRTHSVGVMRYRAAPAEDCEHLLDRLCAWINQFDDTGETGIVTAIIKAVLAHLYIAWIHPFGDGNGRTARLIEFQLLISAGIPAPAAHLLSNHCNQTRADYYRQLDNASRSGGDVIPFLEYAVQGFLEGLRGQLERIREQTWDVVWCNFVHERFAGQDSRKSARLRHLTLDLSIRSDAVPISEIPDLTPRLSKAYARLSQKTLTRDLEELEEMSLILRQGRSVRPNREQILSFIPVALRQT